MRTQLNSRDVLLVIDVQNDFCSGGTLAVPEGEQVIPVINKIASCFPHIVLTQDWHPRNHGSFASSHPGKKPFETVSAAYGEQTLWPDHCVQNTEGAMLHSRLQVPAAELILRKGFRSDIDSYSAFQENDRTTKTGLAGYLRERGLERVFVVGLAYDYCVRFSAVDAQLAGFSAVVIEDACRAIDLNGSVNAAKTEFASVGVRSIYSSDIL